MDGRSQFSVLSCMARRSLFLSAFVAFLVARAAQSMSLDVDYGEEACVIINAAKGQTINGNFEVLTPGRPREVMVILRSKQDGVLLYKKEGLKEDYFRAVASMDGDYEMCFMNGATESINRLKNRKPEHNTKLGGLDARRKEKRAKMDDERKAKFAQRKKMLAKGQAHEEPDFDDVLLYSSTTESEMPFDSSGSDDDFMSWYSAEDGFKTFGFGLRLGEDGEDLEALSEVSQDEKDMAKFLQDEADILVQTLSVLSDHQSYMRGHEEFHRDHVGQASSRLMWCTFIEALVLMWVSWTQLAYIRRFFETKRVL